MSPAIAYPSTVRQWQKQKPLNGAHNDYHTEQGVRISQPIYVDVPNSIRKALLNGVRTVCSEPLEVEETVDKVSSIRTISSATKQSEVETYLGMTIDVLRTVLFSRGGLQADLLLRLQDIAGIEVITEADVKAAFKARQKQLIDYLKESKTNAS